jgi:hypothetical protein
MSCIFTILWKIIIIIELFYFVNIILLLIENIFLYFKFLYRRKFQRFQTIFHHSFSIILNGINPKPINFSSYACKKLLYSAPVDIFPNAEYLTIRSSRIHGDLCLSNFMHMRNNRKHFSIVKTRLLYFNNESVFI